MNDNFWIECEQLAEAAAMSVAPALLAAYLNKSTGVPGAPAITLKNVGNIAGTVAAATVLQHIAAQATAATSGTSTSTTP